MKAIIFLLLSGATALGVWLVQRSVAAIREARDGAHAREQELLLQAGSSGAGYVLPAPDGMRRSSLDAFAELLLHEERAVHGLLKTAVPEYEILVNVDSRKLLGQDASLTPHLLDFVVCSKDFRPLAVIALDWPHDPNAAIRSRTLTDLANRGLKIAHWRVEQLPERVAVRGWLLDRLVPGERRFAA
ncbi:hypothetical protein GCM10025771_34050 [Niveibacterium umoris]|uniref:DUF2726 domain-containing protein n=1 Tax=Niveibacterium umoris TaxID=1193620 RepID=A0A840BIJ9_9RHOO|nr:hypothetical protein [Niveibacterium umoris]MBB4011402.1 hypothetical protein [Niveibacterium umoris]